MWPLKFLSGNEVQNQCGVIDKRAIWHLTTVYQYTMAIMKPNGRKIIQWGRNSWWYLSSHKLSKVLSLNKLLLGHTMIPLFNWHLNCIQYEMIHDHIMLLYCIVSIFQKTIKHRINTGAVLQKVIYASLQSFENYARRKIFPIFNRLCDFTLSKK